MPQIHNPYHDIFDSEEWSEVYDSSELNARNLPFLRGADLALNACRKLSRPGTSWIDVGCGTGHVVHKLSETGFRVCGLDHDPKMVAAAQRRFPEVEFKTGHAENLLVPENNYDGVIALSLMGCLVSNVPFFREAHRVLRKDGILIFTCTNKSSLLLRLNAKMRGGPPEFYHLYSASEAEEDLKRTGFVMIEILFYNFFLNPGKNLFPPLPAAVFLERMGKFRGSQYLARNFLIIARKY